MHSQINFGYPWYLDYGHLTLVAIVLPIFLIAFFRNWSKALTVILGALMLWSVSGYLISRFAFNVNGLLPMPTEQFLAAGEGKVLDMGAGTGRSTIMVLQARPKTTVVSLDLFGESFEEHFGTTNEAQQRLLSNLKATGVETRATIQTGDMRKLPFEPATFDGIVSTYAIDHLNREGATESLSEAARVLKPQGQFLMMVITKDAWLNFAYGPLLLHAGTRSAEQWTKMLNKAGLQVVEQGTRPGTLYFLSRKP